MRLLSKSDLETGKYLILREIERKNFEEIEQNSKIFECASMCLGKIEKTYPQLFCPCRNSSSTILQQLSVNTQMLFYNGVLSRCLHGKGKKKNGQLFPF